MEIKNTRNNIGKGTLAAILLSMAAALIILRLTAGPDFMPSLFRIRPAYLAIAGAIMILGWITDAIRIGLLVRALKGKLSFMQSLRISLIGAFVSAVTPFDTGGEPVQVYMLQQAGITIGESTAVIAVKTILSALARFVLGSAFPVWLIMSKRTWDIPRGMNIAISIGLALYFIAMFLGVFFMVRPHTAIGITRTILGNRLVKRVISDKLAQTMITRISDEVIAFRSALKKFMIEHRPVLILVALLGFLGWIFLFLIPILILVGMGVSPPYAGAMGIISIFYLAAAYAPTPGASGAAEASFAILFGQIVPFHLLGVFVIIWRFVTYHLTLIVGGALMATSFFKRRTKRDKSNGAGSN
ncbi:MAG TPA: flippase-like domain-containing protein [Firmicutes bacterium]|nr:flippase-like domain-containing protein [Bacillota bacterium]HHY98436.1 flippase-like domain-containing protein [Bacillota bacterium]